jgi:hypothetical protein
VKALSRCAKENPKRRKLRRGSGVGRAKHSVGHNGSLLGKKPCRRGDGFWHWWGNSSAGGRRQTTRGNGVVDEAAWLSGGENPWRANPGRGWGMK